MTSIKVLVSVEPQTIWRHLWESLPRLFLIREEHWLSWATDCCSRGCGWFARKRCSRLEVRSCSLVAVFEQWLVALAHWMPLLCVYRDCRGFWQNLVDFAVQSRGSSSKALVILLPTRAMPAHLSNEIHKKTSRSRHRMKRRMTVFSVLAQTDWQFWILSLYRVYALSLLLQSKKNYVWLYWTVWEICTALHVVDDDHG